MIINDKQVNLWRGTSVPPTIYHIWIYNDTQMKVYDGNEWVVFSDDAATIEKINQLIERVDALEQNISDLSSATINGKEISTNPVLDGRDLKLQQEGTYVDSVDSLSTSIIKLDILLSTQIIE